jgi:formylglycine-generating enzyme required for sulfatase activity
MSIPRSVLFALLSLGFLAGCGSDETEDRSAIDEAKKEAVQKEAVQKEAVQEDEAKDDNVVPLGENFTIPDLNLTMIWVKPGTFMMGSPESEKGRLRRETQHQVTLTKGFHLGKYEVTQAQWERVMGSSPSSYIGANRPVEMVSWFNAVEFCAKLTEMEKKAGRVPEGTAYQLPTEAQWEYACRAGTTTVFSWGNSATSTQANFKGTHPYGGGASGPNLQQTTDVGQYAANPWGFHDMHGNVWEWCADWYDTYPSGSVTNPKGRGAGSYRVNRGGSFNLGGALLRSAQRSLRSPSERVAGTVGFRVSLRQASKPRMWR